MSKLGMIAAATLLGAVTVPALAAEPSTLVIEGSRAAADNQRSVAYGDLQLASAQGREQLRQRVAFAIAELCDPRRFSVAEPHDAMKCSAQAWSEIEPRLEQLSPRLASR